jgi:hypothetical protein
MKNNSKENIQTKAFPGNISGEERLLLTYKENLFGPF